MSAPHAYERDPYLRELPVRVLAAGSDDGPSWAVPDDTVLYPAGGGQPADRGLLGDVPVVDVRTVEDRPVHFREAPVREGPTLLRLDWARRFDHMQQHTGQHLLTAVAADRFGWETTAFHLGPETCDVELAVPSISPADLERLEEAMAAFIRSAVPVTARRVLPEELPGLAVRSRGLPEGHSGDVRLVEIAGVDLNTCGGTHLRSTAELEGLKLLGTERLRGGTRLSFVAGGRVRRRLGAAEERSARLRALLGAPDAGLAEAVAGKLAQLAEAQKALRGAEGELAEAKAEALAAAGLPVVDAHFEGRDLAFLGRVAKRFTELPAGGLAFLTGERDGIEVFVLAAGAGSNADVRALGSAVAAELGGRGGGSGKLFQGKASLERRAGALNLLLAPSA